MEGASDPSPSDRVIELLEENAHGEASTYLEGIPAHSVDDRKTTIQSLQSVAADRPALVGSLCPVLTTFLEDEERSVRLSTAKLFVAVGEADAASVEPVVDALADRLADDEEFYYVRARCAEALGYVALDHPEVVTSPEILADLRIGLSFDEPEVKEKLAKALEHVALGDPGRLAHQVQVSLSISTTTRNSSDITWVRHWYSSAVTLPRRSRRRVTRSQRDSPTRTHTSEAGPPRRWPCLHDRKLLTRCFPRANP